MLRFESLLEETRRLQNVGFRLMTANHDQCKKTGATLGISILSLDEVPKEIRATAAERLKLGEAPTVVHVVPGSPAEKAGVKAGDVVIRLAGKKTVAGRYARREFARTLGKVAPGSVERMQVLRGSAKQNLSIRLAPGCGYPVFLAGANETNAYTDGRRIVLQRGMLAITSTDEELALIVGHELAHITSGHLQKKSVNQVAGTFGGLALDLAAAAAGVNTGGAFTRAGGDIGRRAYSQSFEKEADYVGLYFVARAGYDIAGVEKLWRKMGNVNPESIYFAGTHPTSAERFLILSKTRKEIDGNRKARQALLPNQLAQR